MSSLMQWGFIRENRKTTLSPCRRVSKQFLTGKYGKFGGALTVITRGFSENVLHRRWSLCLMSAESILFLVETVEKIPSINRHKF
jgi:hypothetical protein